MVVGAILAHSRWRHGLVARLETSALYWPLLTGAAGDDGGAAAMVDWTFQRLHHSWSVPVRGTVKETLNTMLETEADRLCNAGRYWRTEARRDQRSSSSDRKLQTKAGEVRLKVPKLRQLTFETAIIERYRRRRESSVEEAPIEMYMAGVSVRRVPREFAPYTRAWRTLQRAGPPTTRHSLQLMRRSLHRLATIVKWLLEISSIFVPLREQVCFWRD